MRSSLLADVRYYRRVVAHYRHSMAHDYLLKRLQFEPDCLHLEKIDVLHLFLFGPLPRRPLVKQVSAPSRTRGVCEQKEARRKSPERSPLEKTGLHGPPRQVLSNLLSQLDWEIGRIVFSCHCMERNRSRPRGTSFSSDKRCPRSTSHCRAGGGFHLYKVARQAKEFLHSRSRGRNLACHCVDRHPEIARRA